MPLTGGRAQGPGPRPEREGEEPEVHRQLSAQKQEPGDGKEG